MNRWLRQLHRYLGVFFSPLLLLYIATGWWQTVTINRNKGLGFGKSWIERLSTIRLDAPQAHPVVATTDDVALKTIMANQISAVMHHFYQMTFRWRRWGGLTRPSRRPHRHCGCNA